MRYFLYGALLGLFAHLLILKVVNADPRIETRDGFCHFQIDPNDPNDEEFASACQNGIHTYSNGHMADGDAIWIKRYNRGRTPIGIASLVKLEQVAHNTLLGDTGEAGEFILAPCFQLTRGKPCNIKRVRLTGETSNSLCVLVNSNNQQYTTEFWTAEYDLYDDGTVKYTLECRNATR